MPNHYRCTVTCAFCGCRKHYEDEGYHKRRSSAKLKNENSQNGGQNGKATVTWAWASPRAMTKAKNNAKGGLVAPNKKHEKNQENFGGNPNQHQGGQTLSPVLGSKIRGLRPILKCGLKLNNNKETSVAMKMKTSWVPAKAPA